MRSLPLDTGNDVVCFREAVGVNEDLGLTLLVLDHRLSGQFAALLLGEEEDEGSRVEDESPQNLHFQENSSESLSSSLRASDSLSSSRTAPPRALPMKLKSWDSLGTFSRRSLFSSRGISVNSRPFS